MKIETCSSCAGTAISDDLVNECEVCEGSGNARCPHGIDPYYEHCDICSEEAQSDLKDLYADYHASVL